MDTIRIEQNSGSPWGPFPKPKSFFEKLEKWNTGLESDLGSFTGGEREALQLLVKQIEELCIPRRVQYAHYDFLRDEVKTLLANVSRTHSVFGGSESDLVLSDVDAPRPFRGASLLRATEAVGEMLNVSEHIETLLLRIRSLLTDTRMKRSSRTRSMPDYTNGWHTTSGPTRLKTAVSWSSIYLLCPLKWCT